MSLVVAQTTHDGPRIVSDTWVSLPYQISTTYKQQVLKSIVITSQYTVSFAGDVKLGLDAVRNFAKCAKTGQNLKELTSSLVAFTTDSRKYVEFIVAESSAISKLIRIKDGEIETGLDVAWIGDQIAFERFQQERNKHPSGFQNILNNSLTPSAKITHELANAMNSVISDPSITSVDGFCITASAFGGQFNYLPSTSIHVGRDITIQPGEDLISKMAQSVEEGGYSVSVVEPLESGTSALGLCFPRARLGMLYLPLEYDDIQIIKDVSPNEFSERIYKQFGIKMSNPGLIYKNNS